MRRPLPDLFKRNIWASWIMLETESLQGRPQSKNPEQWQPSLTKEDLAGGQGEQGCGEVPVAPLSILYISDKLGGTESWVNSSKQCQGSQPHPLDPPHLHKVSQVPSPRSQEPRSHFPARPPPWMMEGKSSEKMTVQGCHRRLWWGHRLGLGPRFRSWLYHISAMWLNLIKF